MKGTTMVRRLLVAVVCIAAVAGLPALAGEKELKRDPKLTIAVIPQGTTHEFWKSVHAGAVKASRELDVDIIWKGPLKEDDREAQIAVVEDMITRGVSGIVLAPLDDTALRTPVAAATRAKIPVVIFDSDLKSEDCISFVATDNCKGGTLAGDHLAKLIGGKGKVVMLRYQEGSASTMNREKGFLDAIAKFKDITVASSNQYGGATTETAMQASEDLLAPVKTDKGLSIDGIFCPNESTTFGMLRALQGAGFAGKVKFVGFDSSVKLIDALKAGQINGLILQNPMKMGYLGVKTVVEHLNGKKVEKRIDTGVQLVTKENMDQPGVKEVLQPDLSILDQRGGLYLVKARFDPQKRKMLIVPFSDPAVPCFDSPQGTELARNVGDYVLRNRTTEVMYDSSFPPGMEADCKEAFKKSDETGALKALAQMTNCELVLTGKIEGLQMGGDRKTRAARGSINFSVQVYDARKGSVVWRLPSTGVSYPNEAEVGDLPVGDLPPKLLRRRLINRAAEVIGQCFHDHLEAPQ